MKQFLFLFGLSLLVLAGCKKESAPVEQNYDIYVLGKTPNSSSGPFLLWKNGEVVQTLPYNVDKNYDLLVLPGGKSYISYTIGNNKGVIDDGEQQYYFPDVSGAAPMIRYSPENGVCYFDSSYSTYKVYNLQGKIVKDFPKERLSHITTLPSVCTFDGTHAYFVYTETTPSPEYFYKTWLNVDGQDVSSFLTDTPQYIVLPKLITSYGKDVYYILYDHSLDNPWLIKNNKPFALFDDSSSKHTIHAITADENNAYLLGTFSKKIRVWKNREPIFDLGSTETYSSKKNQIFVLDGHVFTQLSGNNGYVAKDGQKVFDLPVNGECFYVVRKTDDEK